MRALGIDTATSLASVGVVENARVLAERSERVGGAHAVAVLPLIREVLASSGLALEELDLVAVSIGPGSFTGVRVGLSTGKGLALAAGLRLVGVSTLEALACAAGVREGPICPILDAKKGEIYGAVFRRDAAGLHCCLAPTVASPEAFAESITTPCTFVGDALGRYGGLFRERLGDRAVFDESVRPSGGVVALLGVERVRRTGVSDEPATLEPTYVRVPDAQRKRDERRSEGGGGQACEKIDRLGEVE